MEEDKDVDVQFVFLFDVSQRLPINNNGHIADNLLSNLSLHLHGGIVKEFKEVGDHKFGVKQDLVLIALNYS